MEYQIDIRHIVVLQLNMTLLLLTKNNVTKRNVNERNVRNVKKCNERVSGSYIQRNPRHYPFKLATQIQSLL